ncbi:hypothetical protein NM208_g4470 [Fusarium decemcellulare]|uniref:Uncharacterized protein n=1 Tax=Fusarium decemcellulare TaxID=57161 RepID=A0ACC1SKP1_9HYPO|nr:hypothetical protein NM208_g4470 [Fusarium decemcellulare]
MNQGDLRLLEGYDESGSTSSSHLVYRPSVVTNDSLIKRSFKRFSLRKTPKAPEPPDTWGQFGLNLLHSPLNPLIDFIFVHGLRGGSIKTWAKSGNLQRYWPQAWLPLDENLQHVRIHSFGYNSDWGDTGDANLDIHDFGRSLFGEMRTSPELRKGKPNPIVLIGHSMGGLVIKKAYLLAREDETAKPLADRIQCIFFLATPHRGSDAAKMLDRILRATTGTKPYVAELNRNSGTIASINDAFRHHTNKLQIWSFYETMKTKKAGNAIMVVDRESAVIGAPHEHINPLNADHISVCKFESPDDPNYVLIKNSLAKVAEDILSGEVVESGQQLSSLEEYLLIQHYPEDDLDMIESKKIAGSCEWITSLQSMTAWRDSLEQDMVVHWLSGQAGVGKSVMIAHMIRHLEQIGSDTCYYFFRDGRKAQQTVSGLLRSLAYQMAVIHPSVREALNNLREAGVVFDGDDERVIWRKVFIQCIFKIPISKAQFWVVDGLDECLDISKLFSLLARVEARFLVRLHLSSRRLPELEKLMYRRKHPLHHHIEVENTVPDIKQFIETRAHELPVEDQHRQELVEKLVTKSRGVFLWAELACEELGQVFYEDEIDAALERVPAGMSPLYNKILGSMEKDTKHKPLIQAVLEWTVCATRPMTIEELQAALSFDRRSKVHNVRKIVEQLCGQLLRIDNDVVQMIHGTARVFLLDPSSATSFAIDKATVSQRLAAVCLEYLAGSEMCPPRHPMLLSTPVSLSEFANYASISWSDHLESSPSIFNELSSLVDKFFRTNVLAWVEYILNNKASLYYLARVSKNLGKYLDGFVKDVSLPEAPHSYLQRWVTDLMRLSLRFGEDLLRDPATIHFIVPQLCPRNSAIHQQFAQTSYGPRIKGLTDPDWDDCVSYIDYRDSMALCLASCEERFAIGMMSGTVRIYREATCQIHATLDHGEPVNLLQFDGSSERLASSGRKLVKLWTVDGSLIWSISIKDPFVAMAFVQSDQILSAVDKGSSVVFLNSLDGSSSADILVCSPSRRRPPQIVTSADICPEGKLVALAYRGKPAQIWSTERNVMIKECHMARDQIGAVACWQVPAYLLTYLNKRPQAFISAQVFSTFHQRLQHSTVYKSSSVPYKSSPAACLTTASCAETSSIAGRLASARPQSSPRKNGRLTVLGFHNIGPKGSSLRISATQVSLRGGLNDGSRDYYFLSSPRLDNRGVRLKKPVFFAHVYCWRVARQRSNLSHTQAFKLGQQTQHMLPPECWKVREASDSIFRIPEEHRRMKASAGRKAGESSETLFTSPDPLQNSSNISNLAKLLFRCAQLPAELHRDIIQNLPHSLVRCLISASHTADSLAVLMDPQRDAFSTSMEPLEISSQPQGSKRWLCAPLVSLFGHTYLRNLKVTCDVDQDNGSEPAIPIENKAVVGVRFVLALHGLSAISIIYEDGESSPWLGDWGDGWYGSVYGPGLESLWDLKVTKVGFDGPGQGDNPTWPTRALWDFEPKFKKHDTIQIADTLDRTRTMSTYPEYRMCHYLPLEINGQYATGLQVYISPAVILGGLTVFHGDSGPEFTVGWRRGDSYYFQFKPGERITFMALLASDTNPETMYFSPGLLIQTNLGRSSFFGAPMLMRRQLVLTSSWSFITPDNSGYVTASELQSAPVAEQLTSRYGPYQTAVFYLVCLRNATGGGFTTARLSQVHKLEVQRTLGEATGMLVHHHDGIVETLGTWAVSNIDVVEIYNSVDGGSLDAVSFHYRMNKDVWNGNRIANITVGEPAEADEKVFTWKTNQDQDICWCFCSGNSTVMPWAGVDVPVITPLGTDSWEVHEIISPGQEQRASSLQASLQS